MFANDQVIFYTRYLCIIKNTAIWIPTRLLPYPKYDESQSSYYHTVAPYGCSFICVPMVVEDFEMTERFWRRWHTSRSTRQRATRYNLEGKTLRDNESTSADIILKTRL